MIRSPSLLLPAAARARIAKAAEGAYPEECCGLLIGRREGGGLIEITDVAESDNVAPPPRHNRFEVDPALRFALIRRLRGSPEEIVGHYHSHPDAPPFPSARDIDGAFEADLVWLIVAVAGGVPGWPAAFLPDPAARSFVPLSLTLRG